MFATSYPKLVIKVLNRVAVTVRSRFPNRFDA